MNDRLVDPHTGEELELPASSPEAHSDQPEGDDAQQPETALQRYQREWAKLAFERSSLLRLAALPADRTTGLRPLMFASLDKVSRHNKEVSLLRLRVRLPGSKEEKGLNQLDVWVDHKNKEISVLPEHGLHIAPLNRGLGRFLLASIVRWCSPSWSDYSLPPISLKSRLVADDAARLRRDHALQAQGFSLTYEDAVQMSAVCGALKLEQLHAEWNKEKVRELDNLEVAQLLHSSDMNLKAQTAQINQLLEKQASLKRDDNTLRFTIVTLIFFSIFQACLLIWMASR